MGDMFGKLTSRNLMVIGLVLIFLGNIFKLTVLEVKMHELIANIGALLLVVGVMQWFFDQEGRRLIIDDVKSTLDFYFSKHDGEIKKRDFVRSGGVIDFLEHSRDLHSDDNRKELGEVSKFIIGVHYSDGFLSRFKDLIESRLSRGKEVHIHRVKAGGAAAKYLEHWHVGAIVSQCISKQDRVVGAFKNGNLITIRDVDAVQKYSFIYTEKFIWVILSTSSMGYVASIPALKIQAGTAMYEFLKNDIENLGAMV
ncbi:hypothetical protein KIF53_20900 [Chromobacterium subtsugae]|uniref:SMODS-associating 2TM beta-strand rich effector domain-containing protein n=1 Tax=Chromobacterium subtsugae TaxID=251747 RepID=A0ABS7FJ39_9NEIS|nr:MULTISPECIES: hypothetical protein [Chromobacterium]MBW7568475.1 hypothetical protein [Chromobacterium subtsugae]MBW8290104.1 hypothetical protein [Chromobacterium subtsugae]WSE89606.1 hypothetical protein U6115_11980 [Chromobacterium subtsugae]WVH57977.1 hypothetical protein U6151_12000 [Chromobacterium subtsugae]